MTELNTYRAFYRGKRIDVRAHTSYEAQTIAATQLRAKKQYEVTVILIAKDDTPIPLDPASL